MTTVSHGRRVTDLAAEAPGTVSDEALRAERIARLQPSPGPGPDAR